MQVLSDIENPRTLPRPGYGHQLVPGRAFEGNGGFQALREPDAVYQPTIVVRRETSKPVPASMRNLTAPSTSNAEDIHAKINRIESDVNRTKEEVSSLIHLRETGQKIARLESDVDEIKRELAGLSSVRVTLAELQAQLQMLLSTYVIPGQLPAQMYPSAQVSPYH
ncbi:hypothetical protein ISF_09750 [Cordyceps fumosorosea ARSEF 2679]|uniref:Uncharacterized protein n=1 Tax=Cordyceps fumosorosea (strain ARSEF 2679) TaxID=1081104 RepID=A0A167D805_CORFA|nr:hypothetical protein ISF_09750 [Cordyceps fumosorosea ARSEF 2679]OAA42055.1 hypothetical protein ISF_09750 [Cordyceps fumosorosea ARSEF 2679]